MERDHQYEPPPSEAGQTELESTSVVEEQTLMPDTEILKPQNELLVMLNALMHEPANPDDLAVFAENSPILDASAVLQISGNEEDSDTAAA